MLRSTRAPSLFVALASTLTACARGEPPAWSGDGAIAPLPAASQAAATASAITAPQASTSPSAGVDASSAVAIATIVDAAAPATDDVGEQTRDKPSATSPAFEARARSLFDAVAQGKPELARGAFFPVGAYQKVKAVGNPAGDWRVRLLAAYERDIRDLHVELGARAARARYVGIDVPEERGRWVEPGEEYNKLGYYRVFGSRLKYEVDGHERSFLVKSLISWRGEWYVVHLSGMK